MSILDDINFTENIHMIAFIGGGGKTTLMYKIAHELTAKGKQVVCTTTTHIRKPLVKYPFHVVGTPIKDNDEKLSALTDDELNNLCTKYDVVLVEADGSRGLPLKLPAQHEPVIPSQADLILCIAGLDALNKPIQDICHRANIVSEFLQKSEQDLITASDIARVLIKLCTEKIPAHVKAVPVLNKVNTTADIARAKEIQSFFSAAINDRKIIFTGRLPNENVWQEIYNNLQQEGSVVTATELFPSCGQRNILNKSHPLFKSLQENISSLPNITKVDNKCYFIEKITTAPHLVIAGGGHVALAVAKLAAFIGMQITIIDSRKEFANKERFPMANNIYCCDFSEGLQQNFGTNTYFVIVTQGHAHDQQALETVLKNNYRYIGMIGSKKKTAFVMSQLKAKGFTDDVLQAVHSPIGLNIGGITPEEIGISIIAEIIQEMNLNTDEKANKNMPDLFTPLCHLTEPVVLATILEKEGSSPRGIGARMLIKRDGSILGTIGGGAVEFATIKDSLRLFNAGGAKVVDYGVNLNGPNSLGMACGGRVKVLLECIEP